jgi:N-acetylneuraminic acid mutarotase
MSEQHKQEGNKYFKERNFREAIKHYILAIEQQEESNHHILYNNLALSHLLLGEYEQAAQYARKSITYDDTFVKAYYTLSRALKQLDHFVESLESSQKAIELLLKNDVNSNTKELVTLQSSILQQYRNSIAEYGIMNATRIVLVQKRDFEHSNKLYPYNGLLRHNFMGYSTRMKKLFLVGGREDKDRWDITHRAQLYSYDAEHSNWESISRSTISIAERQDTEAYTLDIDSDKIFIYSGYDLRVCDLKSGQFTVVSISGKMPYPRASSALTYNNGRLYLFGGAGSQLNDKERLARNNYFNYDKKTHNDRTVYEFDIKSRTWTAYESENPIADARFQHTIFVRNNSLIVLGGFLAAAGKQPFLLEFDLNSQTWRELNTTGDVPYKLIHFSTVLIRDKIYLYGGLDPNEIIVSDKLFELDLNTLSWRIVPVENPIEFLEAHKPRFQHGMAYNEDRNSVLLFGGSSAIGAMGRNRKPNDTMEEIFLSKAAIFSSVDNTFSDIEIKS